MTDGRTDEISNRQQTDRNGKKDGKDDERRRTGERHRGRMDKISNRQKTDRQKRKKDREDDEDRQTAKEERR